MRRIEFDQEGIKSIIDLYAVHQNMAFIAREFGVDPGVIKRVLVENNIEIVKPKKQNPHRKVSDDVKDKVVYNYTVLKLSLQKAGAEFNLSQGKVESILKERGVQKRTYVDAKQLGRKFELNDDFFKTQTSDMAYILGLLASDGNISSKENGIFIELQKEDSELLENIKNVVGSTRPIDYYTNSRGKDLSKFAVWSAAWKKDLAVYNIVPRKTFILKPPIFLAKCFNIDFIRGYFDGDGSVYQVEYTSRVQIDGASKEMMSWIRSTLATQYGISNNQLATYQTENDVTMYRTVYSGREKLKLIYNTLYTPNSLYMKRKKEKFETILK